MFLALVQMFKMQLHGAAWFDCCFVFIKKSSYADNSDKTYSLAFAQEMNIVTPTLMNSLYSNELPILRTPPLDCQN
jgi:hypothetical protein